MRFSAKQIMASLGFGDVSGPYVGLFRITGLLPFKEKNSNYLGTRILFCYFLFMNFLFWFSNVCYFFNESKLRIDTLCETIISVSVSLRYYLLIWERKNIQSFLQEMEEIWSFFSEGGRQIVSTFERRMRRLQHCYMFIIAMVNILYPLNALMHRLPPLEPNGTERRYLPYKWFTENAEDMWPGYSSTFAIQVVMVQSSCIHLYLCGTGLGGFVMILTGYFCYLRHELLDSIESTDVDDSSRRFERREIVRFIKLHQRLLMLSIEVEKIGRMVFLVQIATTCYNVSLIGFKLASSDPDRSKYISIFLGSILQLYMCQWSPDCLFDESKEVGQAAYSVSTTWMKHRSCDKFLVLIILRTQRPVQITAGGFVPLSLETFGSMMTSAYSFFTVLRRFDL